MKNIIPFTIAAALAASGFANAQAFSKPSGYYQFDGKAGGNFFVPALIKASVFGGAISGSTATSVTLSTSAFSVGSLNSASGFATHYIEFTSGPNSGVVVDIESNTANSIVLGADITDLSLANNESIVVRPHVKLKELFADSESSLAAFTDSATFYFADGNFTTYFYIGTSGWSSDFSNPDGNNQPIKPGTGFVLFLNTATPLTVVGEVKTEPTIVQLPAGVPTIVGPVNPLVGTSVSLDSTGFENLAAFTDSITVYEAGPLTQFKTYFPLGDGTLSEDFSTPTADVLSNTTGVAIVPGAASSLVLQPGFSISQ